MIGVLVVAGIGNGGEARRCVFSPFCGRPAGVFSCGVDSSVVSAGDRASPGSPG